MEILTLSWKLPKGPTCRRTYFLKIASKEINYLGKIQMLPCIWYRLISIKLQKSGTKNKLLFAKDVFTEWIQLQMWVIHHHVNLQVKLNCNLKCTFNFNIKCRCAFRWTIRSTFNCTSMFLFKHPLCHFIVHFQLLLKRSLRYPFKSNIEFNIKWTF